MTADLNELTHQKRKFLQDCLEGPFSLDENVELKITAEVMNVALNCLADKKLFNPLEIMRPACLNITLALVFGQRYMYNKRDRNFNEIMQSLRLRLKYLKPLLSDFLPVPGFFKQRDPSSIKERTSLQFEYQRKLINHHKDSFNPNALRDLTDQLLMYVANDEDKGLFECSDMETLLLDLLGAGFETTAITITWLLGYMAMFPAIQAQVQKEIDLAVGRDELPSLRDQIKLPYTMATILECQRMACVLPFLFPHKASRSCILKGYHIPKGTWLLCNVWSIHYDPRYWKNPKKFDPTRFLNDEQKLHIPDCFLPYGAGLRECPGQTLATSEIFLFFSLILHQMVVRSPDDTAPFHLQGELDIMHYPKAFKIKVIKRED